MENTPGEEPHEFLDAVEEEIVENVIEEEVHEEEVVHDDVMLEVEHEEVLEEIVEEDGLMYDTDGRVVEYEDMVVYEDEAEVIEEYVEVEDLGNGRFAYVMTDEHGNRRLLKPDEVDAVKKNGSIEEIAAEVKTTGHSSNAGYATHKRGRFPPKNPPKPRQNVRGHMFVERGEYYHEGSSKDINDMTKVDVEKYIPSTTVNRRPLPDHPIFKQKVQRNRKSAPWQDEVDASSSPMPTVHGSIMPHRSPSVLQEDDAIIRFKCPECGHGFVNMDRHCEHMYRNHDCQTSVREVDFFSDREFENFLSKIEKATLGRDPEDSLRKKSRPGSSQVFVCNYMSKGRQKNAELVEVGLTALAERPQEVCSAFVQKTHAYECIRVRYCDQHVHYDGNVGFRVPLAVKRRLFEMSFKRLPVACMQIMLSLEAEQLLPHQTRFEGKLKNLSHVEIVELVGIINASLRKPTDPRQYRVPIKFDTIKSPEGARTLVVKRVHDSKKGIRKDLSNEPSTSAAAMAYSDDDDAAIGVDCDGMLEEQFLYDPENGFDPLIDELSETELGVLEAYERDINIELNEHQKKERLSQKTKFSLGKVVEIYQALDAATHGLSASELHKETIEQLREMASYVVEISCQLDAEVKAQYNPDLRVEDIQRDMIAGIALLERVCQPDTRRRRPTGIPSQTSSPLKQNYRTLTPARNHPEYSPRILSKHPVLQNPEARQLIDKFNMNNQERHQMHHNETLRSRTGSIEPEEDKPSALLAVPDELKAVPWSKPPRKRQTADPNAPPRKRGRPSKKLGEVPDSTRTEGSLEVHPTEEVAKESVHNESSSEHPEEANIELMATVAVASSSEEQSQEKEISTNNKKNVEVNHPEDDEDDEPSTPLSLPTKTRTGRVVKPKKWGDD